MRNSDNPVFNEVKKQLETGKVSFDQAVTAHLGNNAGKIGEFIRDTSIYDLQDHFRAAGEAGSTLLELSDDIVALRREKQKNTEAAFMDSFVFMKAGLPNPRGLSRGLYRAMVDDIISLPARKNKAMADKFFDVLKDLKAQGAHASEKLVASWISEDIVDAQRSVKERNGIRSRLLLHQFDI